MYEEDRWTSFRLRLRRFAVRLVEASSQLPPDLVLNGTKITTHHSDHAARCGSYAIVHRGRWRAPGTCQPMEVAIKDFNRYKPQSTSQFKDGAHYLQVGSNANVNAGRGVLMSLGFDEGSCAFTFPPTREHLPTSRCGSCGRGCTDSFGPAMDAARQRH